MSNFNEHVEQFEQYLAGSLDETEKAKFEKLLESDKTFYQEYKSYTFLVDGIKYAGRNKLQRKLKEWDKELGSENQISISKSTRPKKQYWYVAAASSIIFVAMAAILYLNLYSTHEKLYVQYYKPYEYIPESTRGEASDDSVIAFLYKESKYSQVIHEIDNLPKELQTDQLLLVLGNAYLGEEQYYDAIDVFAQLSKSDNLKKPAAEWYLSLCYLATGQVEKSQTILKGLSSMRSSYASNAKKLLDELE